MILFWNLNSHDLENCEQINASSKQILENPLFWMKKLVRRAQQSQSTELQMCQRGHFSKKNQDEWRKAIKSVKNSEMEKHIVTYLKWALK